MKTSKFSLADLLTVLGALVFFFFCFLSFNFLSLGETIQSILWAMILALTIGGISFGVKVLKITSRNFKTCIIWEWILLLLFAGSAFFSVIPFSHYFAVLEQKSEIQKKVADNIEEAKGMFTDYENYAKNRENIYKSHLTSVVTSKIVKPSEYRDYGFVDGTNDSIQVENKMFTLHAQLFPSNYEGKDGLKQVATNWLANAKKTLESTWAFTFGIVEVIKKLQTNVNEWKKDLKNYSLFRAKGESANDFDFPVNLNDVTGKFTKLSSPSTISIAYAIGLYLLMLLSYFVSKRSTKNHYSLFSFNTGKTNTNDTDIDIKY